MSLVDQWVFVAPEAAVDAESVDVEVADAAAELIHRDFLVAVEVGQRLAGIVGDGVEVVMGAATATNEWTC